MSRNATAQCHAWDRFDSWMGDSLFRSDVQSCTFVRTYTEKGKGRRLVIVVVVKVSDGENESLAVFKEERDENDLLSFCSSSELLSLLFRLYYIEVDRQKREVMEEAAASNLDVISMIIWLSTGNGKFFELVRSIVSNTASDWLFLQHGSREVIKQVLPKSSETAFRWGYYNSPADPDRQSYTQVLEAFLKAGFRIEGSSGAGTQGLLRTQYILVKRDSS